jgi:hypothetical protein
MGMTLWIELLEEGEISRESADHTLMHDHAERLDDLCEELDVEKLSGFFDWSELEVGFDDDEESRDESGPGFDEEEREWFSPRAGLVTLRAMIGGLERGEAPQLDEVRDGLLDELENCTAVLESAPPRARFHLAVVG